MKSPKFSLSKLLSFDVIGKAEKAVGFVGRASQSLKKTEAFIRCFRLAFDTFKQQWAREFAGNVEDNGE